MLETEITKQAVSPNGWEIASIIIGIVGSLITLVSVYLTIVSMQQTKKYKNEAEQSRNAALKFKELAAKKVHSLDMYSYAESLTQAVADIARVSFKPNNNKAGKLNPLFERLIAVISNITKYTTLFGETDGKFKLELQKTAITNFIIVHRADTTVDIRVLNEMFEKTELTLRNEIKDYQDKLNQEPSHE